MRKHFLASLAVFAFVLALSESALGCECVPQPPEQPSPEEARAAMVKDFNGASAIFAGKVVEADLFEVKFKVERSWKGNVGKEFGLATGAKKYEGGGVSISGCDYIFSVGDEYLVYAYPLDPDRHPDSTALQARQCTRTRLLKGAAEDIEMLEQLWPRVWREHPPDGRKNVRRLWVS